MKPTSHTTYDVRAMVKQSWADELCPGIRDLVLELNSLGYITTDSGDGSNYWSGMSGALPYRHVFGIIPPGQDIRAFCSVLAARYPTARVEATYAPGEDAVFMLLPDGYTPTEQSTSEGQQQPKQEEP